MSAVVLGTSGDLLWMLWRKNRHGVFAGKTVWSMPERFEIIRSMHIKALNKSSFLSFPFTAIDVAWSVSLSVWHNREPRKPDEQIGVHAVWGGDSRNHVHVLLVRPITDKARSHKWRGYFWEGTMWPNSSITVAICFIIPSSTNNGKQKCYKHIRTENGTRILVNSIQYSNMKTIYYLRSNPSWTC